MLRAQIQQPGYSVHARHRQIEQNEIDVARALELPRQLVERARLQDLRRVERRAQRLAERAAKERMIVDDDEPVLRHGPAPYHLAAWPAHAPRVGPACEALRAPSSRRWEAPFPGTPLTLRGAPGPGLRVPARSPPACPRAAAGRASL